MPWRSGNGHGHEHHQGRRASTYTNLLIRLLAIPRPLFDACVLFCRTGLVPLDASRDTAGPLGRTMEDVAIVLGAIVGADPADALTTRYIPQANVPSDYTQFLNASALQVH